MKKPMGGVRTHFLVLKQQIKANHTLLNEIQLLSQENNFDLGSDSAR